jgi:hypothetical protein
MSRTNRCVRRLSRPEFFVAAALLAASPAVAETASAAAGRYAVLRGEGKDTGCMVTLETVPRAGGLKAQLAPACRDNGVVVFDPVSWSLERGRLALTARKGHKAHFDRQPDGGWHRDAKEGKALILKPIY